jgi:hypothetical protein
MVLRAEDDVEVQAEMRGGHDARFDAVTILLMKPVVPNALSRRDNGT